METMKGVQISLSISKYTPRSIIVKISSEHSYYKST